MGLLSSAPFHFLPSAKVGEEQQSSRSSHEVSPVCGLVQQCVICACFGHQLAGTASGRLLQWMFSRQPKGVAGTNALHKILVFTGPGSNQPCWPKPFLYIHECTSLHKVFNHSEWNITNGKSIKARIHRMECFHLFLPTLSQETIKEYTIFCLSSN